MRRQPPRVPEEDVNMAMGSLGGKEGSWKVALVETGR
jgi:hypothetical protein